MVSERRSAWRLRSGDSDFGGGPAQAHYRAGVRLFGLPSIPRDDTEKHTCEMQDNEGFRKFLYRLENSWVSFGGVRSTI